MFSGLMMSESVGVHLLTELQLFQQLTQNCGLSIQAILAQIKLKEHKLKIRPSLLLRGLLDSREIRGSNQGVDN